jgi:putative hydrolase of the HAD superfamily
MPTPLKAVIFDYGNVLSEPQKAAEIQGMAGILDLPASKFEKCYWTFREAFDEAKLKPHEYWNNVAHLAKRTLPQPQMDNLIELDSLSWMHPRTTIVDWACAVRRAGIRIALLSNMPVTLRDALQHSSWMPAFEQRTFSCDLAITKPSPEIYLHCLGGLGLAPADVLFLDDREPNVQAAHALGMYALQFTTPLGVAREIEQSFDIPVPLVATVGTGNDKDE